MSEYHLKCAEFAGADTLTSNFTTILEKTHTSVDTSGALTRSVIPDGI